MVVATGGASVATGGAAAVTAWVVSLASLRRLAYPRAPMRRFLVLGLGASLLSCRAPTEIVVDVTTDIPCTSLTRTTITVGRFPSIEGLPPATICRGGGP